MMLEQLVGREDCSLEIAGQEQQRDEKTTCDITESQLQECHIAIGGESNSRDAEKGNRAGLSGDNRTENRPPRHVPVAEQVGFQVSGTSANPET